MLFFFIPHKTSFHFPEYNSLNFELPLNFYFQWGKQLFLTSNYYILLWIKDDALWLQVVLSFNFSMARDVGL